MKLWFNDNKIGDIGAEKLAEALPNLTHLTQTLLGSLSPTVGPICFAHIVDAV